MERNEYTPTKGGDGAAERPMVRTISGNNTRPSSALQRAAAQEELDNAATTPSRPRSAVRRPSSSIRSRIEQANSYLKDGSEAGKPNAAASPHVKLASLKGVTPAMQGVLGVKHESSPFKPGLLQTPTSATSGKGGLYGNRALGDGTQDEDDADMADAEEISRRLLPAFNHPNSNKKTPSKAGAWLDVGGGEVMDRDLSAVIESPIQSFEKSPLEDCGDGAKYLAEDDDVKLDDVKKDVKGESNCPGDKAACDKGAEPSASHATPPPAADTTWVASAADSGRGASGSVSAWVSGSELRASVTASEQRAALIAEQKRLARERGRQKALEKQAAKEAGAAASKAPGEATSCKAEEARACDAPSEPPVQSSSTLQKEEEKRAEKECERERGGEEASEAAAPPAATAQPTHVEAGGAGGSNKDAGVVARGGGAGAGAGGGGSGSKLRGESKMEEQKRLARERGRAKALAAKQNASSTPPGTLATGGTGSASATPPQKGTPPATSAFKQKSAYLAQVVKRDGGGGAYGEDKKKAQEKRPQVPATTPQRGEREERGGQKDKESEGEEQKEKGHAPGVSEGTSLGHERATATSAAHPLSPAEEFQVQKRLAQERGRERAIQRAQAKKKEEEAASLAREERERSEAVARAAAAEEERRAVEAERVRVEAEKQRVAQEHARRVNEQLERAIREVPTLLA